MNSVYNKVTNLSIPEMVGLVIITIPGYIIYKDCISHKINHVLHTRKPDVMETQEEDILEAKIRSENFRPGPAFLNSHTYRTRRVERVKAAYTSIYNLVNQNLDLGNQNFRVALSENDKKILNVCRRLLIEELSQDGYSANITIHEMGSGVKDVLSSASIDSETVIQHDFYFDITID